MPVVTIHYTATDGTPRPYETRRGAVRQRKHIEDTMVQPNTTRSITRLYTNLRYIAQPCTARHYAPINDATRHGALQRGNTRHAMAPHSP